MARTPKPWYRKDRDAWFVTIDGERHNLGSNKDVATKLFHEMMAKPAKPVVRSGLVVELFDRFLTWVKKHQSLDTYIWYQSRLQRFADKYPDLEFNDFKPFHVQEWIDEFGLSSGSKRNYARSVVRCMNWCEEQGIIDRTPLAHFKKPRGGSRDKVISSEEYAAVLASIRNNDFRDLVMFIWETGARAAECLDIEDRHVDCGQSRIVFPINEEKMERAPRIIYMNEPAKAIMDRRKGNGHIFTNTSGKPWTTDAVNCAFLAIQIRMGKTEVKPAEKDIKAFAKKLSPTCVVKGKTIKKTEREKFTEARRKLTYCIARKNASKLCLTNFRHTWCHNALKSGLDVLTVATLMGHADTTMVAKIYSHLNYAQDYLLGEAKRAGKPKA
jgi:integrase